MPWSQCWRPGGSVTFIILGWGLCPRSSGVCPRSGTSPPHPLIPHSWVSVVLEADPVWPCPGLSGPLASWSCVSTGTSRWGAAGREKGDGGSRTQPQVCPLHTHAQHGHTRSHPLSLHSRRHSLPHTLTDTHTLCTRMHTPSPTHTHTDTAFTPTCLLTLMLCGAGPARERPSQPQAGPGLLPLSIAAVHSLLPLVPAWGLCFLTCCLGGGLPSIGTSSRLDI